MSGTRRGLAVILGLCVVAIAGSALAANSGSFGDPRGDASSAPDLTDVTIASDDTGTITVRVNLGNGPDQVADGEIDFAVDVDQNPDTGSNYYGTEFAVTLEKLVPKFFGVDTEGEFVEAAAPASFHASFAADVATFVFKGADVGIAPSSGFNVVGVGSSETSVDTAPDIGTINYQLVAGTPALAPGPDTRAPVDYADSSSGTHGKRVDLWYYVADGRAETADLVRVYRGAKVLKTIRIAFADTNPFFGYVANWRVPKKVRGKLRFCVSSVDRAGNKSNVSCARLTIK
jgi:hypothetical protein